MIFAMMFLLLLLMLLRAPIAVALGLPALVWLFVQDLPLAVATQRIFGTLNNSVLLAVPMFLLAGRLMNLLGVTERIFDFAMAVVGHIRGGLGHVVVTASMIFSAMSGSAAADAVGVATITVKAARERAYDPHFAAAITLAASALAPIIPPSIIMIIYGATANVSIGKLFVGGVLPGLLFGMVLLITVSVLAARRGYPRGEPFSVPRLGRAFKRAFLVLLTPVIIIGGIFGGIFTPTEAATVAVLYVLALGLWYRAASWRAVYREFVSAGATVGVLLLVVGLSGVDGWIFTYEQLPVVFADAVSGAVDSQWAVMLLLLAIVLVLGMFMDATPVILMAVPVIIIGGIFGGIFTPTEAATVAVLYVLALGLWYRAASWRAVYREFVSAGATVGVLLLVVGLSGVDGWIFTYEQLPVVFADAVSGAVDSQWAVMLLLLAIVLVLGMFMDATPVILMAVPVMLPLVKAAGLDPVHFGVLFCIMCVIGLVTPPVGVALYGVATVTRLPMERVFWAMLPFFFALLGGIVLLVFFPQIVTFLPGLLVQ